MNISPVIALRDSVRFGIFVFSLAVMVLPGGCFHGEDQHLDSLREMYAMSYFEPAAHLQLARGLREDGQPLIAFFVSEMARRTFDEAEFDRAFAEVFLSRDPIDDSPAAEAALRKRMAASPSDRDLMMELASLYISRSDWEQAVPLLEQLIELAPGDIASVTALAEIHRLNGRFGMAEELLTTFEQEHPDSLWAIKLRIARLLDTEDPASARELLDRALAAHPDDAALHYMKGDFEHQAGHMDAARASYEKAADLAPEDALIQGWVARFFLKALGEEEEALERYITTYFLDPHFYDTEYAEGRVRHLAWERAEARIETARSGGASWAQILRSPDPMVLTGALESLEGEWDEELVPVLVGLVEHDIISVRGKAMDHLCRKLGPEHDDAIRDLLSSRDPRVMGLTICLAVDHWEEERWEERAEELLHHPAQLVRADAISTLMSYGGERGRQMVMDYAESGREPNARIIELMESQIEEAAGEAGADGFPPN